jgi:hypothetical protein
LRDEREKSVNSVNISIRKSVNSVSHYAKRNND